MTDELVKRLRDAEPEGMVDKGWALKQEAADEITRLRAQVAAIANVSSWPYYPIEMPVNENGNGPATVGVDAVGIEYEVWDKFLTSYSSHKTLPSAIEDALARSLPDAAAALDALLERAVAEERESADQWRALALQFDQHRMKALGILRAAAQGSDVSDAAKSFLNEPPQDGDELLDALLERAIKAALEEAANACSETRTTGKPHGPKGIVAAIRAIDPAAIVAKAKAPD